MELRRAEMSLSTDRVRPVRVLVADLSPLVASGVMTALNEGVGFDARRVRLDELLKVGVAGMVGRADDVAGTGPIDVVIVDAASGPQVASALRIAASPSLRGARILVVSQGGAERDIRQALESGIHGYGTLGMHLEELRDGVLAVARGRRFVCARSAQRLAEGMTREPLTRREAQVLNELSQGKCNKTIAAELEMALGTVKAHMKSLMAKLDAKTRTQVVSVAIARGLIDPGMSVRTSEGWAFAGFGREPRLV